MHFNLHDSAQEHILIVAHRGVAGGNIPCNTIASYEIALKQGADMLEVDVTKSADGELFLFHPGMEPVHLNEPVHLEELPYSTIRQMQLTNGDRTKTQFTICSFDEVLERFKNRCYINVDKFWSNPKEICDAIKRHNMEDQILIKSPMDDTVFKILDRELPKLAFMPIVSKSHPYHDALLKSSVNYVGVEALFADDQEYLASDEFMEQMHNDNILVWVNSIIYDYRYQLSGLHSDDTALTKSEDEGWGWLADKGFDFIQTDWPLMLRNYLESANKYHR